MRRRAFTLTEVLIVVIIIGILAAMAIPGFNKTMEKAREKDARAVLELIYNAQRMYRIDNRIYTTDTTDFSRLGLYIDNPNAKSDYYDYAVSAADATTFSATATRKGDSSKVLTVDQTGEITGP